MKTKLTLLLSLFLFVCSQTIYSQNKVKGNGTLVTKEFKISTYNHIEMGGSMELIYEENAGKPYLEITTDENVMSYIKVEVKGKKLSVKWDTGNKGVNINPTVYKIRTNSPELVQASLSGSGDFKLNNLQKGGSFKLSMAGSGKTTINRVDINEVNLNMSGSGRIEIQQISANSIKGNISGSGKVSLNGIAKEGNLNVSGSGKVNAEDCRMETAKATVSGSGTVSVYVTEKLTGNVAGSGKIYYKGNPSVNTSVAGSGKVKSID